MWDCKPLKMECALLLESVAIADDAGITFAVIGGWSPLLLNSSPIPHPGRVTSICCLRSGSSEKGSVSTMPG